MKKYPVGIRKKVVSQIRGGERQRALSQMIDRYIHFYNHKHIQLKTGVTPLMLRHST